MLKIMSRRTITLTFWILAAVWLAALGTSAQAKPTADFSVNLKPGKSSVLAGQATTFTVTISPKFGFNAAVALSISGLPADATATFNPASFVPLKSAKTSTLTVQTAATTPAGSYVLPVTVTGGGITHTANASLVVKSVAGGFFTISAAPDPQSVQAGQSAIYAVTLTGFNGFNSAVTLSLSGLPPLTSASFSQNPVTPTASGAASTLTITTTDPMPPSVSLLTITGTTSTSTGQASVSLDITFSRGNAPPGIYMIDNGQILHMDDITGMNLTSYTPPVVSGRVPLSVMVGPDDHIYVAANSAILRFDDMTGANLKSFGTFGEGVNQFYFAKDVWVAPDMRIYVADAFGATTGGRLDRMDDLTGTNWTTYKQQSGYYSFQPYSITTGPDGLIYFTDRGYAQVERMDDMTGAGLAVFGGFYCLTVEDPTTWSPVGAFCVPSRVRFGPDRRIYVSDAGNCRIVRMDDISGTNYVSYGVPNYPNWSVPTTGKFDDTDSVALGPDSSIYVADSYSHFVAKFADMVGTGWMTFTLPDGGLAASSGPPTDVFVK